MAFEEPDAESGTDHGRCRMNYLERFDLKCPIIFLLESFPLQVEVLFLRALWSFVG